MSTLTHMSPTAMVGRSWNLFRNHFKLACQVMALPMALVMVQAMLSAVPNILPTWTGASPFQMGLLIVSMVALVLVAIGNACLSVLATVMMKRLFYITLTQDTPARLIDGWRFIEKSWAKALGIMLFNIPVAIAYILVDVLIVLLGFGVATLLMGVFAVQNTAVRAGAIVAIVIWGFLILSVFLGLLAVQMVSMSMPLLALVSGKAAHIGQAYRMAYACLGRNLPKAALFGALIVIFTVVISQVIQLPINVWFLVEYSRIWAQDHASGGTVPWYVTAATNMWTSLTTMLLIPFNTASLTLFWYDCQVSSQGLDLQLWLDRLKRKHLKSVIN